MAARVVAATHQKLSDRIVDGQFRQDLFARLAGFEMVLPPLRDRREDIPVLANHFLRIYARKYGRPVRQIADDAMAAICAHAWPGNVRALRHAVERAVVLSDGDTLRVTDFSLTPAAGEAQAPVVAAGAGGATLAALEKQAIAQALQRHAGNVTHAAHELGITRTSLYRRMEKHGL